MLTFERQRVTQKVRSVGCDLPPIKWTRFVSRYHSLVFCRGPIPNTRVQPFLVIELVDIAAQDHPQLLFAFERYAVDGFRLQAVEKRLHMRIVRALVGPIHAGLNSVPAQLILD